MTMRDFQLKGRRFSVNLGCCNIVEPFGQNWVRDAEKLQIVLKLRLVFPHDRG